MRWGGEAAGVSLRSWVVGERCRRGELSEMKEPLGVERAPPVAWSGEVDRRMKTGATGCADWSRVSIGGATTDHRGGGGQGCAP
jgi:hypothetical protein